MDTNAHKPWQMERDIMGHKILKGSYEPILHLIQIVKWKMLTMPNAEWKLPDLPSFFMDCHIKVVIYSKMSSRLYFFFSNGISIKYGISWCGYIV